jgi:hypothetical protein
MGSQRNKLSPIRPIYPTVKVARDEEVIGHTKAGNIIVRRSFETEKIVPVIDPKTKLQRYRTNALGQPVTAMNKRVKVKAVEEYEKVPQSDGSVFKNRHYKMDPEEVKRQERAQKIREMQERMAEALVDNDLTIDSLIGAIKDDEKPRKTAKAGA